MPIQIICLPQIYANTASCTLATAGNNFIEIFYCRCPENMLAAIFTGFAMSWLTDL